MLRNLKVYYNILLTIVGWVQADEFMKHTYSVLPIYEKIIRAILDHGIRKLPEVCKFTLGVPVGPMLAKPTTGVSEVLNKFQGMEFSCEYKYDGERAQVKKTIKEFGLYVKAQLIHGVVYMKLLSEGADCCEVEFSSDLRDSM